MKGSDEEIQFEKKKERGKNDGKRDKEGTEIDKKKKGARAESGTNQTKETGEKTMRVKKRLGETGRDLWILG